MTVKQFFLTPLAWIWTIALFPFRNAEKDKQNHAIVGYFVGFIMFPVIFNLVNNLIVSFVITVVASLGVGYAIEYIQKKLNKGVFEHKDARFVMYGAAIMSVILLTLKTIGL